MKNNKVTGLLLLILTISMVVSAEVNSSNPQTEAFKKQQQEKSQAYLEQLNKDSEAFMKTLVGKNKQEKLKAVAAFKEDLYNKNCAFRDKMYRERRTFVEGVLKSNQNAAPAMKEKMLSQVDKEYEALKAFHVQKQKENVEFLDKLSKDSSMDGGELDEALKNFFQSQKEDAKEFLNKQQSKYQQQKK